MLPKITKAKAQGNYRCIPKVSKHLRGLLECNNQLRPRLQIFDDVSIGFYRLHSIQKIKAHPPYHSDYLLHNIIELSVFMTSNPDHQPQEAELWRFMS